MNEIIDISIQALSASYLLLLLPLGIALYLRLPLMKDAAIAIIRMTVQLLFVGFYLEIVFRLNNPALSLLWLLVMVAVADGSILRGCRLRIKRFMLPVFIALLTGTVIPVLVFVVLILQRSNWLDAQYVIPLAGMVLGNCLRADIIGLMQFYESIRSNEKVYHQKLAQGARLQEALLPYWRDAMRAALVPTIATMATIGLVSLPGMMTGAILSGTSPMTAIKYQIAIMIAIFSGTATTVFIAIWLTIRASFNAYGILDKTIFAARK
jgi:putative ABC transport system permease protein